MNSNQFGKFTAKQAAQLTRYVYDQAPGMVITKVLRFIDDNFRMQGWQGASFQPWAPIKRKGTILVKTGALRRSTNYSNAGAGIVRFYNNLPYAAAHNNGFNGTVNVSSHKRATYLRSKVFSIEQKNRNGKHKQSTVTNKVGEHEVSAHVRKSVIIQRQFAPTEASPSPVLEAAITKELTQDIYKILNFQP